MFALISFGSFIDFFLKFLCDFAFSFYPIVKIFPSLHEEVLQQAGDEDGEAREDAHDQRREALVARDQARPLARLRGAQLAGGRRLLAAQREQGGGAQWSAQFLAGVLATAAGAHAEAVVRVALETGDLEYALLSLKNLNKHRNTEGNKVLDLSRFQSDYDV